MRLLQANKKQNALISLNYPCNLQEKTILLNYLLFENRQLIKCNRRNILNCAVILFYFGTRGCAMQIFIYEITT